MQLIFVQEVLFEPSAYTCDSRHKNLIAFQFDLALLRRVLQAAEANDADTVEVSQHNLLSLAHLVASEQELPMSLQIAVSDSIIFRTLAGQANDALSSIRN